MAPAPWEAVSPRDQLFVLITGANSGVGLGCCQRLIDEFLATRPLTSHLILIPTTRSPAKSLDTIRALRAYAAAAAKNSTALRSRAGPSYDWTDTVARIHVLSLQLDLCDLRNVRAFAQRICSGTVSNPEGLDGEYLRHVKIPRLDTVFFNAAYGNWVGVDFLKTTLILLRNGPVQTFTWPSYQGIKINKDKSILNDRKRYNYPSEPLLGEVFCACFLGHYMLGHYLLPLLSRSSADESRGRIIWASSVEATRRNLDTSDIQGVRSDEPYESAKRLIDVLPVSLQYPSVRAVAAPFFRLEDPSLAKQKPFPPKVYTTHCGVLATGLFPCPWFLFWAYQLALLVCRWLGSPWHTLDGYSAAKVASWIALQEQSALDEMQAENLKLGSCTDGWGHADIKKTEVEDYGWEGKVVTAEELASEPGKRVLCRRVGRRYGVADTTEKSLVEFQELGAECWRSVEELRLEWEAILDRDEQESD